MAPSPVSSGAGQGPDLSQPGAEADLHPSVSKCTQIRSVLRGIGITSRRLKEERQRAFVTSEPFAQTLKDVFRSSLTYVLFYPTLDFPGSLK